VLERACVGLCTGRSTGAATAPTAVQMPAMMRTTCALLLLNMLLKVLDGLLPMKHAQSLPSGAPWWLLWHRLVLRPCTARMQEGNVVGLTLSEPLVKEALSSTATPPNAGQRGSRMPSGWLGRFVGRSTLSQLLQVCGASYPPSTKLPPPSSQPPRARASSKPTPVLWWVSQRNVVIAASVDGAPTVRAAMDCYGFQLASLSPTEQSQRAVRGPASPGVASNRGTPAAHLVPLRWQRRCSRPAAGQALRRVQLLRADAWVVRARAQACAAQATIMAKKWATLAPTWEPTHGGPAPPILKNLVRKHGIPPERRPALWLQFSGGAARRAAEAAPNALFARLLRRAAAGSAISAADVGPELTRAFGPHKLLGSVAGVVGVTSLLQARRELHRV